MVINMVNIENLEREYNRQWCIYQCNNAIGRLLYYASSWQNRKILGLWSDRADCQLTMPWGSYAGRKSVERCYLNDYRDRDDEGVKNWLKGIMYVQSINTPLVEISADGKTAKGIWVMSGHETWKPTDNSKPVGHWAWGKYAVDFILEDGQWKIWKLIFYPLFRTEYGTPWADASMYNSAFFPTTPDSPPTIEFWSYSPDNIYPDDQPKIPVTF